MKKTAVWETKFEGHLAKNRGPLYILYKIPLTRAFSYLPSLKCTRIGERASVSFPHWTNHHGCDLNDAISEVLKGLRMVARALWRSEARRVVPWSETLHEP